MDTQDLIALVEESCSAFPAVARIERSAPVSSVSENELARVVIRDFVPGQESEPWVLFIWSNRSYRHPLFGNTYQCIELSLDMAELDTDSEMYGMVVATYALPCMESQRFCPGASVNWDVDGGHLSVCGQVRLTSQPYDAVVEQLGDMVRSIVALAYLITFKLWQMQPADLQRRDDAPVPEKLVHDRMLAYLGIDGEAQRAVRFID